MWQINDHLINIEKAHFFLDFLILELMGDGELSICSDVLPYQCFNHFSKTTNCCLNHRFDEAGMGYATSNCSSFSYILSFYNKDFKNLIFHCKNESFHISHIQNETQTCYSGVLSFPFSYLKIVQNNACFKKFGIVDIGGPWIFSGLFYLLLAALSDCSIRQILEIYKHMHFAYSLPITETWKAPDGFKYIRELGCPLANEI